MTIRLSSGLCTAVVTNTGLGACMQYGHVRIYGGTQPLPADAPPASTLLARVSADGITPVPGTATGGLEMQGGAYPGELVLRGNWVIKGLSTGVPMWWRFVANAFDNDTSSPYLYRIDGEVGESLVLGTNTITPATSLVVASFNLIFPPY